MPGRPQVPGRIACGHGLARAGGACAFAHLVVRSERPHLRQVRVGVLVHGVALKIGGTDLHRHRLIELEHLVGLIDVSIVVLGAGPAATAIRTCINCLVALVDDLVIHLDHDGGGVHACARISDLKRHEAVQGHLNRVGLRRAPGYYRRGGVGLGGYHHDGGHLGIAKTAVAGGEGDVVRADLAGCGRPGETRASQVRTFRQTCGRIRKIVPIHVDGREAELQRVAGIDGSVADTVQCRRPVDVCHGDRDGLGILDAAVTDDECHLIAARLAVAGRPIEGLPGEPGAVRQAGGGIAQRVLCISIGRADREAQQLVLVDGLAPDGPEHEAASSEWEPRRR